MLAFVEDILKAQLFTGKIFDGLTDQEKAAFRETVDVQPSAERVEWLVNKFQNQYNFTYEVFINILCFIHTEATVGAIRTKRFVMNYIHEKHLLPRKY